MTERIQRLVMHAFRGIPGEMGYHKIVAADAVAAGVLDQNEIDDARRQLPERRDVGGSQEAVGLQFAEIDEIRVARAAGEQLVR